MLLIRIKRIYYLLLLLSVAGFLIISSQLAYPFVTVKALVFRTLMLLVLPLYVYLLTRQPQLRPSLKNPLTLALLGFLAAGFLAGAFGVNFNRSFWGNFERMGGMYNLLYLAALYFYLELLFKLNPGWWLNFLKVFVWLGVLTSIYGLFTKLGFPDKFYPDAGLPQRVSSIFGNPIFFASFLVLPMFTAAFLALQNRRSRSSYWWWAAAALQLLGIYFSATRGAEVGLAAGLAAGALAFLLYTKNRRLRLYGLGVIAAVLAGLLGIAVISKRLPPDSALSRLADFSDSNTQARLIQWQTALKGFKDRPLLGTGPENYYVIANQYFNPAIYQFDRSWFDKPHNYFLEILTTEGILGLLAYLALLYFSWLALRKAYRAGLLSLPEFCFLLAGLVAYQAQNFFVFDTVGASFAFFVFSALMLYLWREAEAAAAAFPSSGLKPGEGKKVKGPEPFLPQAVLAICALAVLAAFYFTDFLPAKAMYDLSQGTNSGLPPPRRAAYFVAAAKNFMNYDLNQTAQGYEEFITALSLDYQGKADKEFIIQTVKDATIVVERALSQGGNRNNPVLWYKLANLKATTVYLQNAPFDQSVKQAADTAVSLAPSRVEPKYYIVQYYQLQKDWKNAIAQMQQIVKIDYTSPYAKWRLALMYREASNINAAVNLAQTALRDGYEFTSEAEMRWLVNYYADLNQIPDVIKLYQRAIKLFPSDYQLYANLASAYAKIGEKHKAIEMAQKVEQLNPQSKAQVDAFIKSLQ